jgi:hypothetical protein
MGRQTRFHMLEEDCRQFLEFLHQRDPVIVVDWRSKTAEMHEAQRPWERGTTYYLWNQAVLPILERKFVEVVPSAGASYYGVDASLHVIEFWYPSPVPENWNGRPSLTQGRVWAQFENPSKGFERWYSATVRWLRKNFVKVPFLDYVGPAAYRWFKEGGLLLPHFRPPITSSWLSWVEAQDQHRAVFSK